MISFALALALAFADPPEGRDWAAALRIDATSLHDEVAENHPGPVNPDDPGFAGRNDAQLALALKRAQKAATFADYFYAMQEYAASFDDGHIGYGVYGNTPDTVKAWPGFLTRYQADGHQQVFASEDWSRVPVGARLVSCDGLSGDQLFRKRMGSRVGRSELAAQRQLFGAFTFFDTGNPYVGEIRTCRFESQGEAFTIALQWRPPDGNLYTRYSLFPRATAAAVGRRRLANGTQWLTLPSFSGDPDSETGKALKALIADMERSPEAFRAAPAIVLDLRGNGGGSSDWSDQLAVLIWGEGAIARHPETPMTVSWRASQANLGNLRQIYADRSKGGNLSPDVSNWFESSIHGLEKAIEARQPLWVIPPSTPPQAVIAAARALPVHRLNGPVYVLTDPVCMSACLDAVDLWTRLGAIPVGRETGADTLYMEVREVKLPARIGAVSLPMKVYSGRPRGSNQPVVPRHRFHGDMADTGALERWIAMLPERSASPKP